MPDNTTPAKPTVPTPAQVAAASQSTSSGSSTVPESKNITVPQAVSTSKTNPPSNTTGNAPTVPAPVPVSVPVPAPAQSSKPAVKSVKQMMDDIQKEKAAMTPEQKKARYMKLYGTPDSPWNKGEVDLTNPDLEYESQLAEDQ